MYQTTQPYWTNRRIRIDGVGTVKLPTCVLEKPYALIGSHASAELVLTGDGVKRRHLFALATDEGIHILDLVQGNRQGKQYGYWLRPGQELTIGAHRIRLSFAKGELPTVTPDNNLLSMPVQRPYPMIVCKSDGTIIGQPYLNRPLAMMGRRDSCKFQFTTRSVSPEHCVFYQQSGRLWVVDFHSTRRTENNGKPIDCAELQHGSSLKLGRVEIDIHMSLEQGEPDDSRPEPQVMACDEGKRGVALGRQTDPDPPAPEQPDNLLKQAETDRCNAIAERDLARSDLDRHRQDLRDLQSLLDQQVEQGQQLQSELVAARQQIQLQHQEQQDHETVWREKESQLIQQVDAHHSLQEKNQQELMSSKNEISRLNEQVNGLQTDLSDKEIALADIESVKTNLQETMDQLEAAEEELAQKQSILDERDRLIEQLNQETESRARQLEQQEEQHRLDAQDQQDRMQLLQAEIQQRTKQLDQLKASLDERESGLSNAREAHQKAVEELATHQESLEQDRVDQQERQEQLTRLDETQRGRESELRRWETQLENRRGELEKQESKWQVEREQILQETAQAEDRLHGLGQKLQQKESEMTRRLADQDEVEATRDTLDREKAELATLQDKLNHERANFEKEQAKWRSLISEREKELQDRDAVIRAAEQKITDDQVKIDADRQELDHYFAIDRAQRQVLANLNALQKEKSTANRFWGWLGFPFRKP